MQRRIPMFLGDKNRKNRLVRTTDSTENLVAAVVGVKTVTDDSVLQMIEKRDTVFTSSSNGLCWSPK